MSTLPLGPPPNTKVKRADLTPGPERSEGRQLAETVQTQRSSFRRRLPLSGPEDVGDQVVRPFPRLQLRRDDGVDAPSFGLLAGPLIGDFAASGDHDLFGDVYRAAGERGPAMASLGRASTSSVESPTRILATAKKVSSLSS